MSPILLKKFKSLFDHLKKYFFRLLKIWKFVNFKVCKEKALSSKVFELYQFYIILYNSKKNYWFSSTKTLEDNVISLQTLKFANYKILNTRKFSFF